MFCSFDGGDVSGEASELLMHFLACLAVNPPELRVDSTVFADRPGGFAAVLKAALGQQLYFFGKHAEQAAYQKCRHMVSAVARLF